MTKLGNFNHTPKVERCFNFEVQHGGLREGVKALQEYYDRQPDPEPLPTGEDDSESVGLT